MSDSDVATKITEALEREGLLLQNSLEYRVQDNELMQEQIDVITAVLKAQ